MQKSVQKGQPVNIFYLLSTYSLPSTPNSHIQTFFCCCLSSAPETFTDGPDLRKRVVAAGEVDAAALSSEQPDDPIVPREAPPKPARSPPKTPTAEAAPAPARGAWSPLMTCVCMCTVLAAGAYVCYRTYFHWCPVFRSVSFSIPPSAGYWREKKKRDTYTQTLTLSQLDLSLSAEPISLSPSVSGEEFQRLFSAKLLSSPIIHTLTHNLINVCPFKTSGPHNSGVAT